MRPSQVARLLGVTERTAKWRLARLVEWGLIVREGPGPGRRRPYIAITRAGLAEIANGLPEPRYNAVEARHDVGVAWAWLAASDGAFGELAAIHSERKMRSADRRAAEGEERFGLRTFGSGPRGGRLTHYPDLLIDTQAGHRIAVELELTRKAPARLEKILSRYVADRRIDGVVYLVDDQRIAQQVQSAARRAGASDLVHVQWVRWAEESDRPAPEHGRTPAQTHGRTPAQTHGRTPAQTHGRRSTRAELTR